MQRRNVLLPEPVGPMMHITSFGKTSRSMPRSTSKRPKLLCTASALTIGVAAISVMQAGQRWGCFRRLGRRRVKGEEHPAEPLQRRQWQFTLRAAREVTLDVVLADGEDRGHGQIPEAGDDRQLDNIEVG